MKTNFVTEIKMEFDDVSGKIECAVKKDGLEVKQLNFNLDNVAIDKENRVSKLSQIFYDLGLEIAKRINTTGIIYREEIEDLKKENDEISREILKIQNILYRKHISKSV